jgi:hypothetical protein
MISFFKKKSPNDYSNDTSNEFNEEEFEIIEESEEKFNLFKQKEISNLSSKKEKNKFTKDSYLRNFIDKIKKSGIKKDNKNAKHVSKRDLNIKHKLLRQLIQFIFLNWINFGQNIKLKKIEPKLLLNKYKDINDCIDKPLSEIYSNNISKREIKDGIGILYNINLIYSLEKNSLMKKKLSLTFRKALRLFFNNNNDEKEKLYANDFLNGLENYISYIESELKKINPRGKYFEKLANNLVIFKEMTICEQTTTTGLSLEES